MEAFWILFYELKDDGLQVIPRGIFSNPSSVRREGEVTRGVVTTARALILSDPSDLPLSKTLHTTPFLLQSDWGAFNVLCPLEMAELVAGDIWYSRGKGEIASAGEQALLSSYPTLKSPSEYKISLLLPRPCNSAQEQVKWP